MGTKVVITFRSFILYSRFFFMGKYMLCLLLEEPCSDLKDIFATWRIKLSLYGILAGYLAYIYNTSTDWK